MNTTSTTEPIDATALDGTGARYLRPGDPEFAEAVGAAHGTNHAPALVAMAKTPQDVAEAVRLARAEGYGVGVMATGHGTGYAVRGGLLINTSGMRGLLLDPVTRVARAEAGVTWEELNARAARHGLFGLQGSNSVVGVVGYTLGGGFGWLGRHHGLASGSVLSADAVSADGELLRASATEHPELFWGLRGSAGNLGVVTAIELRLVELDSVYGGALFYPLADAARVLAGYAAWAAGQPDELASSVVLANFPPLPIVPEPLRGGSFACVRLCYSGLDPVRGAEAARQLRGVLGEPLIDQLRVMPASQIDTISAEPRDPVPVATHSALVRELSPQLIDALTAVQTADSPLVFVELRQLGGALRPADDQLSPLNRTDAGFSVNAIGLAVTPELEAAVRARLSVLRQRLDPLTDGAGYVNFLEGAEGAARMKTAFAAADWNRLMRLKTQWDPTNLFRFNRNIPPYPGPMSVG